jgi:hypothetical protein
VSALSLAGLVVGFLIYHLGGHWGPPFAAQVWLGSALKVKVGKGDVVGEAVRIEPPGVGHIGMFVIGGLSLAAQDYPYLEILASGFRPGAKTVILWRNERAPEVLQRRLVTWSGDRLWVRMDREKDWRGTILTIGIAVTGDWSAPRTLHQLALRPRSARNLLLTVWSEWTAFEGWQQYSINRIVGGPRQALVPIVPAVAAWIGLALLLYGVSKRVRGSPWDLRVMGVIFLLGWFTLDARWEMDLGRQLGKTARRFAGKTWTEKRLAAEDGPLFELALQVKAQMPSRPQRIFLVTPTLRERLDYYEQVRTSYHLLPHNVSTGWTQPPTAQQAHRGDYVLMLRDIEGVDYDSEAHTLRWGMRQVLSAQQVFSTPLGRLFQVL